MFNNDYYNDMIKKQMEETRVPDDYRRGHGNEYFWILTPGAYGRTALIGPKSTAEEANEFAMQKLDQEFKVIALTTRDRTKAAAMIKARRLEESRNLVRSMERVSHPRMDEEQYE